MAENELQLPRLKHKNIELGDLSTNRSNGREDGVVNGARQRLYSHSIGSDIHTSLQPEINMRQYAQQLAPWVYNYRLWSAMSTLPPFFTSQMSCLPFQNQQMFSGSSSSSPSEYSTSSMPTHQSHQHIGGIRTQVTNRIGSEFTLPPLWKRVMAELIDFVVLFYLKIIIMIMVMRQMGILKTENVLNVHIDFVPYFDLKNMEMDIDKAFTMTSEIIALEIVNRIMITLFETCCLRKGVGRPGGATPGKRLMGMVVVSCDNIIDLGNGRVVVVPAGDIGFINALVRSVIKNFTLAFFFPACFTVFFFQYNRAAYDILAKTIVVELPVRERQNQR